MSDIKAKEIMKACSMCGYLKPANTEYFHKESKGRGGLSARCKDCKNETIKQNYHDNIEATRARCRISAKKWRENHRKESRERSRLWAEKYPERIDRERKKETCKEWHKNHPNYAKNRIPSEEEKERTRERSRIWYQENRERANKRDKRKYKDNPEKFKIKVKEWRLENPEKYKMIIKRDYIKRMSTAKGRIDHSMSMGITTALSGKKNGHRWESLVGYTLEDLMDYLEKRFKPNMTWENYGKWHVDHKIPKTVFNYHSPQDIDFKRCWSLKNLRPMWAKENMSKGARIERPFQPCLSFSSVRRENRVQV